MKQKILDVILKALGVFDILWGLVFIFLFIGSQLGFIFGLFLGIFYIISGSGLFGRSSKSRKRYLKWIIPLSLLGVINLIPFTNPEMPKGFRMSIFNIIEFSTIYIFPPLILNIVILTRSQVENRFR